MSLQVTSQISKFMGPTWGPPGSCRPQMGPMLAPWILLSGIAFWQTQMHVTFVQRCRASRSMAKWWRRNYDILVSFHIQYIHRILNMFGVLLCYVVRYWRIFIHNKAQPNHVHILLDILYIGQSSYGSVFFDHISETKITFFSNTTCYFLIYIDTQIYSYKRSSKFQI